MSACSFTLWNENCCSEAFRVYVNCSDLHIIATVVAILCIRMIENIQSLDGRWLCDFVIGNRGCGESVGSCTQDY
jgi:hypothetical protein